MFWLLFKFLIHFELTYICDVRLGANCILLAYGIQLSQKHLFKKRLFSTLSVFGTILKNQLVISGQFRNSQFCAVGLYVYSICMLSHCFDYCSRSLVSFEISRCESSNFILFSKSFWLFGALCNSTWLWVTFFISASFIILTNVFSKF